MDPTRTYPIGAPRTHHSSHRGTLPTPIILFQCMSIHSSILMHAFIHPVIYSSIHSSHTSKHCICNCCIIMLCVVSRSGSCLIQREQRPTGVQRKSHKGLEAAPHQIEPGEKMQMSPNSLCLTRSEADRVISTFSFDPNLEPCPQNLHQGDASGPPRSVSRMTQASVGMWVKEQWNAT